MISFGMLMSEYSSASRASPFPIGALHTTHFDRDDDAGSTRFPTRRFYHRAAAIRLGEN
jgi:hypothetical protein